MNQVHYFQMHSHPEVPVHMSFGKTPLGSPHLLVVEEDGQSSGTRETEVEILGGAGKIC